MSVSCVSGIFVGIVFLYLAFQSSFAKVRGHRSVIAFQVNHVVCLRVSAVSIVFPVSYHVVQLFLKVYCFSCAFLNVVLSAT